MQKRSSKLESTRKFEQNRSCWKILTMVKVNGQLSTNDVCWRGSVTSPRAYVAGREAQQARGAHGRAWDWRVADTGGAWSACSWGRNFSRRVWCSFWPFLVGFCSGFDVLSFYACYLAVECTERWYPSVAVLWAWRRWLAFDSDDWMKARAAEKRRRCPQEPKSQRNGSDTMLTI